MEYVLYNNINSIYQQSNRKQFFQSKNNLSKQEIAALQIVFNKKATSLTLIDHNTWYIRNYHTISINILNYNTQKVIAHRFS